MTDGVMVVLSISTWTVSKMIETIAAACFNWGKGAKVAASCTTLKIRVEAFSDVSRQLVT